MALAAGLYRWFHLTIPLRIALLYVVLPPLWHMFNSLFLADGAQDSLSLNLIRLIELGLLGFMYWALFAPGLGRKIILIIVLAAFAFGWINFFFIQGAFQGNTYTLYVLSALSLLLGLVYVHTYPISGKNYGVLLRPWFLISMAILSNGLAEIAHMYFLGNIDPTATVSLQIGNINRIYLCHKVAFLGVVALGFWQQYKPATLSTWSIS